ncbi:hypothetical protein [Pseudonocardia sp. GCM10023141]|uniref:hypothetical protein n=1 Tax=Pseudonocardia sp. GCM10023141 TaxID=3252653 RepID=UPI0036163AC0
MALLGHLGTEAAQDPLGLGLVGAGSAQVELLSGHRVRSDVEVRLERVAAAPDHPLRAGLRRVLGHAATVAIATVNAINMA